MRFTECCFISVLIGIVMICQCLCEISRKYDIGFENVHNRTGGHNNTRSGKYNHTQGGGHPGGKHHNITSNSRYNTPRPTLPTSLHRKPSRQPPTIRPPQKTLPPTRAPPKKPPPTVRLPHKTKPPPTVRLPHKTKSPPTTRSPPKKPPPTVRLPHKTKPPPTVRLPPKTKPPPTTQPPPKKPPPTVRLPHKTKPPLITTQPPPKKSPPKVRLPHKTVPPPTVRLPPKTKPPPITQPPLKKPPPTVGSPTKTGPPVWNGTISSPTKIPPANTPPRHTPKPPSRNTTYIPKLPQPQPQSHPTLTPQRVIYFNKTQHEDNSDDFIKYLLYLKNITLEAKRKDKPKPLRYQGETIEYQYVVRDYYHGSETYPKFNSVNYTSIKECPKGTTEKWCVPNTRTYAMCLANGNKMCVAYTMDTVPCGNQSCVISEFPCGHARGYPWCTDRHGVYLHIPCMSEVKVLASSTDPFFNEVAVSHFNFCAVKVIELHKLVSPVGVLANWVVNLGNIHLNTLLNYTYH